MCSVTYRLTSARQSGDGCREARPSREAGLQDVPQRSGGIVSLILTISSTTSKVSDALIKKVLDQVDDGINFGESAYSPKGSPKLNRRPNGGLLRYKSSRFFFESMMCRAFLSAPHSRPLPCLILKRKQVERPPKDHLKMASHDAAAFIFFSSKKGQG